MTPLIFRFARQVAFELSSDESRTWLKHNSTQTRHLFCWWVSILDQFTRLSISLAKHPKHVMFFGLGCINELPTTSHSKALSILMDAITRYRKIIKTLESFPITAIASAWDANQARDRSSKTEPGSKKSITGSMEPDPTATKKSHHGETVDKSGPLIYTGDSKLMPSPPLPPGDHICAGFARNGYACRHPNCKFIHERDVTKWPVAAFQSWNDMVSKTPGLSWNPALVYAKTLSLKFTMANKHVTDVPPAKK